MGDGNDGGDARDEVETVFHHNQAVLIKWLTKYLGDADSAKDISQATFVNVWKYSRTNSVQSPKALIFKTAANLALNELRRRARNRRRGVFPVGEVAVRPLVEVPSCDASPEEAVVQKQEAERTLRAIEVLPRKCREAFKLHRFDGLSYKQIAEKMGVSESSIEKYMIEALARLREEIFRRH